MITLQRPDLKVSALLGENKGIKDGDYIKPSQYAVALNIAGKQMVLNTFTRQCVETSLFEYFRNNDTGSSTISFDSSNKEMVALVQADYFVKKGIDEAERYGKVLSIVRRMSMKQEGYTGYTILPTTACNARCVYCYEEGIPQENMSEDVIEQTVQYIKLTHRKGTTIRLHWFGGEPMVGEAAIDRICERLQEEIIEYSSSMISNGSLITAERAKKLKEVWRLTNVQITLDGREDVYCERKRYINFSGSPYRAVINGIHELLKQGVQVNIRLNVEEDNLQEMHSLVDELKEEFSNEKKIGVYSHSIFLKEGDNEKRDDKAFYDELDKLDERLRLFNMKRNGKDGQAPNNIDGLIIEEEIAEDEMTKEHYYDKRGSLKRYYCMADNPSSGPVIMPNGEFYFCEHVNETTRIGNIFEDGIVDKALHIKKEHLKDEKCKNCSFLTICTDYSGCPIKNRDCMREMLTLERRSVEMLTEEKKLPPILLRIDGKNILVKEPTRAFAEEHQGITVPGYYKAEQTVDEKEAMQYIAACHGLQERM